MMQEATADTERSTRIVARFIPQAWIHDYAVEINGAYEFDVTEQILAMPKDKALEIRDDDYDSDNLWHENPISSERPHSGPFYVRVRDAIHEYFGE